jgi:AraC-like DNA-binding protein
VIESVPAGHNPASGVGTDPARNLERPFSRMEWRQMRRSVRVRHRRTAGEPIESVHHEEFRSHDLDEAHAWLRKTYADHDLKISGSSQDFIFSCDITRLDGMSLGRMRHSMAVEIDVCDGLRNLSIVEHRGGGAVQVSIGPASVNLRAGECFLLPPDRPYQVAWNSVAAEVTTLSFEDLQRDALSLVARATVNVDFARPTTPAAGRHWSQTIRYVHSSVSNSPLLAAAPLARQELGWLVSSAVLACFPNSTLDAASPNYAGDTPQPLRRALDFIDEHAGEAITLNEIAVAANLSPRGLQAAFRRHLDTTPLARLRSVRMERAHHDLQNAEPGNTSVAALAARWGFTHLGRFAVEYRRRYGSSPSQTLRGSFP